MKGGKVGKSLPDDIMDQRELLEKQVKIEEFDNDKSLLDYRFMGTNIPMWMFVRIDIFRKFLYYYFGKFNTPLRGNIHKPCYKDFTKYNPYFTLPKNVIYVNFWDYLMTEDKDGFISHNFIKDYVKLVDKTSVIITGNSEIYDTSKIYYPNWKRQDAIDKLCKAHKVIDEKDKVVAKKFINYLKEECPCEIDLNFGKNILAKISYISEYFNAYVQAWKTYLKITRPKLVILGWAYCMGCSVSACVLACKELGIKTAEIQHGYVGKGHSAYYLSDLVLHDSDCIKILPDYFLTLGDYWKRNIKIPSELITIGTHRKYKDVSKTNNQDILICPTLPKEGTEEILKYILKSINNNVKVYLRPHPSVNPKPYEDMLKSLNMYTNVFLANEKEMEYYLRKCAYVITDGSTVVYEALYCGNVVYVCKDEMFYESGIHNIEDKVNTFTNVEEFKEVWDKRINIRPKAYNEFYDMNYKKKYREFVYKII